jgi:alkylhydroperoxidase family enzyme
MTARIAPATAPFPADIQAWLDKTTPPGQPPMALFTTLAREPRLFHKFFGASLLERARLTVRQREIVIHRTTALCQAEYEWGVHATIFAGRAELDAAQLHSTVHGGPDDACWTDDERVLLRFCDALHRDCALDDALWADLHALHGDEAVLELLMVAGFYRTVAYLARALKLPLEPGTARFPAAA